MSIQYSSLCDPRLIDAVEHVAGALEKIASAIEHHTDKTFPSLPEKALNLARWSELQKIIDNQIKENERRDQFAQETRAVIEAEARKKAEQIISIKKLKCKHCVFVKSVKSLPAFCAAGKRDVFGDEPACVEINPTQETIDAMGEIKLNQDGEVIP